ncbi:MAG: DUF4159 domain-containing protein [bacterium]|nr:DUF4159 domain-containing protein [bacterium]
MMQNPNTRTTDTNCLRRLITVAMVLLSTLPLQGQTIKASKPSVPVSIQPASPMVNKSIVAGLKFLASARDDTERWHSTYDRRFPGGVDSLVIFTALSLGLKSDSPHLAAAIKNTIAQKPTTVYARAVRLMAMARIASPESAALIKADAAFLQARQSSRGGWGYGKGHPTMQRRPKWTDMCNTTFALLALCDAERAGAEIKPVVWSKAARYLSKVQNPDGGWGYEPAGGSGLRLRGNSFGSMTVSGIASLMAVKAKIASDDAALEKCVASIDKGQKWLIKNYDLSKIPKWGWGKVSYWPYFYLYMLSRVAVESGSAQIGDHAWQGELLGSLVSRQSLDGAWRLGKETSNNDVVHTCFALLAMANARKSVLINKLILPGAKKTDRSDVVSLTGWLGRLTKRDARCQLIPPDASQGTLESAPVLYIALPGNVKIPDTLASRIREYALRGGMVLVSVSDGDSGEAKTMFLSIFEKLQYHAAVLPAEHPAFTLRHKITDPGPLAVTAIGDYCRSRVFLVSGGLGDAWKKGSSGGSVAGLELVVNLAAWSGINFTSAKPHKLIVTPRALPVSKDRTITIARVKHSGDWKVGPKAMRYVHNVLAGSLNLGVKQAVVGLYEPIAPAKLPLLWMTGTKLPKMGVVQKEQLGGYLKGGGMIFVDSAMGKPEFARKIATILCEAVGVDAPEKVTPTNPLITGKFAGGAGSDLTGAIVDNGGRKVPLSDMLSVVRYKGRVVAIVSKCGVTVPLDGGYTHGCVAPSTVNTRRLAANVVLFTATQKAQ